MKITNLTAVLAVVALAAGCAYNDPNYGYSSHEYRQAQRAAELQRRADLDLANSVRDQFYQYGYLGDAARNVNISASSGTVTLAGSVPTQKDREMIEALVRNTRGVAAVNDQLQVMEY